MSDQVVDFVAKREQKMEEKRKNAERVFFKNLLSVYCVVGQTKMHPVEMIEVSENGCSFQVQMDTGASVKGTGLEQGSDVPLRLYFSQDTFICVNFKVMNMRQSIESGKRYVRFGCAVDSDISTYEAYVQFVRFLKAYSTAATQDRGDVSVFYL